MLGPHNTTRPPRPPPADPRSPQPPIQRIERTPFNRDPLPPKSVNQSINRVAHALRAHTTTPGISRDPKSCCRGGKMGRKEKGASPQSATLHWAIFPSCLHRSLDSSARNPSARTELTNHITKSLNPWSLSSKKPHVEQSSSQCQLQNRARPTTSLLRITK